MYTLEIKKSFYKKFLKLQAFEQKKVKEVLKRLKEQNLSEVIGLKRLSGVEEYYRLRIGDIRIGFTREGEVLYMCYIGHRGDFYKKFPKNFIS